MVLATAGCGGTVTTYSNTGGAGGGAGFGATGGSSGSGGSGAFSGSGGSGAFSGSGGTGGFFPDGGPPDSGPDAHRDAQSDFRDPGCPDAAPLPFDNQCDLLHQPGGCPSGESCYPYVNYPTRPCQQEQYGTMCETTGVGGQGDPCDQGQGCGQGFVCVITGNGTQCVRDCSLSDPSSCPQGLFCEPVDVKGVGGCF